jgi:hypothetical protein
LERFQTRAALSGTLTCDWADLARAERVDEYQESSGEMNARRDECPVVCDERPTPPAPLVGAKKKKKSDSVTLGNARCFSR